MTKWDHFFEEVRAVWGSGSSAEAFFEKICGELKPQSVGYLPLHFLVKHGSTSGEVMDFMHWAARLHLFTEHYEYIPAQGDEQELSAKEVMSAVQRGVLDLPDGTQVEDFAGCVFPFFRGTEELELLLSERDA